MSTMLFARINEEIAMSELDAALAPLMDVIRPHEYDEIQNSHFHQAGAITLNFVLGADGLRWFFTRHTYCFLEVARVVGVLTTKLKHQENTWVRYSLDASVVATLSLWIVRERAKEEDRQLKATVGLRLVNEHLKTLKVPSDLQTLIRAEFRHHFKLYISDEGYYSCGLNYLKIREPHTAAKTTQRTAGNVTRLPR